MAIRHIRKQFFDGNHRAKMPEETYQTIKPIIEEIGVRDIVDITSADRLGIPVFSAIRPTRATAQIDSGKGIEPLHAEVSAMMEALERHCAEYRGDYMELLSYEDLGPTRAVDPHDLILPRNLQLGEKLHWTEGWDILNDEFVYVPSNAVYHPYNALGMAEALFRSDKCGLGAGNEPEEAILHGLFEVIERDALSHAEQMNSPGKRLCIDHGMERTLLDTFAENDIEIHLWLLDGKTRIPTVAAAADDVRVRDPALLVMGSGTHTNPSIAVLRALTEVARRRAVHLRGERTDQGRQQFIRQVGYERLKRINRMWFSDAGEIGLGEIPDMSTEYFDIDIQIALQEIEQYADRVCICNLSRTKMPVYRVVVPGFDVSYTDSSRKRSKKL